MTEWHIQPRSPACQGCGRSFHDQEALHTLLLDERQEYLRVDVCEQCWQSQYAEGANHRKGFVSHWQGVFALPPVAPPDPIQKESAESLLRKLVELKDPAHAGACFILAVMLERKRLLKVKAHTPEGQGRVFIYEQPRTGDVFTIPDPGLRLDQLDEVQRDVAHLLEHGLTPPPPPPPPVPTEPLGAEPTPDQTTAETLAAPAVQGLADAAPTNGPEPPSC